MRNYVIGLRKKITVEDLANDTAFLKEVANTIFKREQSQQSMKDKMCKSHSPETAKIWQKSPAWDAMDTPKRQQKAQELGMKTAEAKTILTRPTFVAVDPEFANNPTKFQTLIDKGTIKLDQAPDTQKYGIRVTGSMEQPVGVLYTKQENVEPKILDQAYISFNIDDIVKKIISSNNKNAWDKSLDGKITTICPTD